MNSNPDQCGYAVRAPQQLGAVLQGYRKKRGLTQAQVAHAVGLPQSGVSEMESDPSAASLTRIFKLLSALDLEIIVRPRDKNAPSAEW